MRLDSLIKKYEEASNMRTTPPSILECTLRDGSYVIDFQFTAKETEVISAALDETGFPYIEVGHGIGIGASETTGHVAAASDVDYMKAAARGVSKGKWGMFCIPGVASLDDLRLAADNEMGFIRIGTDVAKANTAEPFIKLARDLGIEVFANFMKSYVMSPKEFAALARQAGEYGAEMVYLVDSAGGMLPREVRSYINCSRAENPELPLGFHGHDNLGLGVANSLTCWEEGADMVDTSLQGFGRGGGNTSTEQFVSTLVRLGFEDAVDPIHVMTFGEMLIRPLIEQRGLSSLDVVSGQALFHSSYMPKVLDAAKKYRIDPRVLIVELCKVDKVNAAPELIDRIAKGITPRDGDMHKFVMQSYFGEEQSVL